MYQIDSDSVRATDAVAGLRRSLVPISKNAMLGAACTIIIGLSVPICGAVFWNYGSFRVVEQAVLENKKEISDRLKKIEDRLDKIEKFDRSICIFLIKKYPKDSHISNLMLESNLSEAEIKETLSSIQRERAQERASFPPMPPGVPGTDRRPPTPPPPPAGTVD